MQLKIVVFDVAASIGGAMSVLKSFYNAAATCENIDWVFVLSSQYVKSTDNVKIRIYDWTKNSRAHRIFFDCFVAPSIVREENPDIVLSLQNINVPFVKTQRITYVHQSIPFCNIKFSIVSNPVEWLYKNVISMFIFKSICNSNTVVVQTEWMKSAIVDRLGIIESKLLVVPPAVVIDSRLHHSYNSTTRKCFFYPAAYNGYKNHEIIIKAARFLRKQGISNFEIVFTVSEQELPKELRGTIGIRYEGRLPFKQVQELYSRSVLVFPSLLETFGLPLVEAAAVGAPIAAAALPYAQEVLSGYENVEFFDPSDFEQLAEIMKRHICGEFDWHEQDGHWFNQRYSNSNWEPFLRFIKESYVSAL